MIASAPIGSEVVVNDPVPPLMAIVPTVVLPWVRVTVPVAVAGPTVAVSVTGAPRVDVGDELDRVVAVEVGLTTWVTVAELLGRFAASPA